MTDEGVGEEIVRAEATLRTEVPLSGVHHQWCSTGIDLPLGQVGEIVHHGAVHKAGTARPAAAFVFFRQYRNETKVWISCRKFLGFLKLINFVKGARPPVEYDFPSVVAWLRGSMSRRIARIGAYSVPLASIIAGITDSRR